MPPYPGLRHFKHGISFVSQWTGREHREMQKVFTGLLTGAVPSAVLQAAVAVLDFIYYAQLHVHTTVTLQALDEALVKFHQHKHVLVDAGIRKHFNIPKIHALTHYVSAIKSRGAADGYNTELPERLHIDLAKDAYRASNRREYVIQMAKWLRRQESVAEFGKYLAWRVGPRVAKTKVTNAESESEDSEQEELRAAISTQSTTWTHRLSARPGYCNLTVNDITTQFAPDFLSKLTIYIQRTNPPPRRPTLPSYHDSFHAFKRVTIPLSDVPPAGRRNSKIRIQATSSVGASKGQRSTPSYFHTVLVHVPDDRPNPNTTGTALKGLRAAQLRFLFELPEHLRTPHQPYRLAYVEWFNPFRPRDPNNHLFPLSRQLHHQLPVAEILDITRIHSSCYLIPKFGTHCDRSWNMSNVLEQCKSFYLARYIDLATFYLDT
ncbi:hypothetical protein BC835DRAFT_1472233 [Cytidiella melzeri]|nr:hypothetical protein BC835DRAFT_1472233 [Cytidiella melzeri]